MTAGAAPAALELERITKRFGDFVALQDVDFRVDAGQVHALLGANGSGKSTLVKVMSGVLQPDGGRLRLAGARPLRAVPSPAAAAQLGIRVVHQEAPLVDTMTVAESYALFHGFEARSLGRIRWRALRAEVHAVLSRMDVPVSPNEICGDLTPADRAGLALAITMADHLGNAASARPVRVLIVDEVTASIPESETSRHLRRIRTLADDGIGVVMVTHRLAELSYADDVTVLRAGEVVHHQGGSQRRTDAELVSEMVGEDRRASSGTRRATRESKPVTALWQVAPERSGSARIAAAEAAAVRPVLEMSQVTGDELQQCSLRVGPGEILGLIGLRHSGLEEIPRILSGVRPWRAGTVRVGDVTFDRRTQPSDVIRAGMAVIPSDRLHAGGVASLSVEENVVLPGVARYWHRTPLKRRVVRAVVDAFDVRPADSRRLFGSLSGGNQQKVLLGKWLTLRPSVLVLDDPTYGVDPAARETIFDAIIDAAESGVGVLFLSTEPEQLARVCHRVLAIHDGRVVHELAGDDLALDELMSWSVK